MNRLTPKMMGIFLLMFTAGLTAQAVPDIALSTNTLNFEETLLENPATLNITITNQGTAVLQVNVLEFVGPDRAEFSLVSPPAVPFTVAANGGSRTLTVQFAPQSRGAKSAVLRIFSNDPDEGVVGVTLQGIGIAPQVAVSPDSLNFGNVLVNGSDTLALAISNTGNSNLTVDALEVIGENRLRFQILNPPQLPVVIAPDGPPLVVQVKFSPVAATTVLAFLSIRSDDPASPFFVPLQGRGVFAQISVTPTSLSFGEVLIGTSKTLSVAVSNVGEGTLSIPTVDFIGSGAAMFSLVNAPNLPIRIPPGAPPVTLTVRFTPTTVGAKSVDLVLTSNDPDDNPLSIKLTGVAVKPNLVADPPNLDFERVLVGSTARKSLTLRNTGTTNLVIDDALIEGPDATQFVLNTVPAFPVILKPQVDSLVLDITFTPQSTGQKTAQLRLPNNDVNSTPIQLSGVGALPDIAASPAALSFGNVHIDSTRQQTLTLFNVGQAPLSISQISLSGENAALFTLLNPPALPRVVAPDSGSLSLVLVFAPGSPGDKTAVLEVSSDDPDENPLSVPLSGAGVQPTLAVTPDTVNFGTVRVGRDSLINLLISNTGSADLVISDTTLSGPHAALFAIDSLPALPIRIAPAGAPATVRLRFSPTTTGPKSAEVRFTTNVPGAPSRSIPLRGVGAVPNIATTPAIADFGGVRVNTTAVDTLHIRNTGGLALTVTEITLADTAPERRFHFQDTLFVPFKIPAGGEFPVGLTFRPDSLGPFSDTLHIRSDDPDQPELAVRLSGSGELPDIALSSDTLNFGVVGVSRSSILTLQITNQGGAPLRIDSVAIAGGNASQFTTSLPPLPVFLPPASPPLSLEVVFFPNDTGRKGALMQIFSDDPDQPSRAVTLLGRAVRPPAITGVSLSDVILNQAVTVSVTATADTTIRTAALRYASNSQSISRSSAMVFRGENIYEATIPAADVTVEGLMAIVEVTDEFSVVTTDTIFASVRVPAGAVTHSFAPDRINGWIMFSLPFEPSSVAERAISAVLADLGAEGGETWKIYRTDQTGINTNYFGLSQLSALDAYGRFEPGNAFWLYVRSQDGKGVPTTEIDFPEMLTLTAETFRYTLQPGWNQLGNPYAFPFSWRQVASARKDSLQVYRWDGQSWDSLSTGTQPGAGASPRRGWMPLLMQDFSLAPWDGYAVFNPTDGPVELAFHPGTVGSPNGTLLSKTGGADWQIHLVAETDETFDLNIAGVNPHAVAEKDRLDYYNPAPVADQYVSLSFHRPEWKGMLADYSSDIRPPTREGEVWYFSVRSSRRQVHFYLRELEQLPAEFSVKLIDRKYRREYDLAGGQKVILRDIAPGEENRFALLVGTPAYLSAHTGDIETLQPAAYELLPNYPNPFNPETHIRYQLAAPGQVSLKIYNLLGQTVATLVEEFQPAGFYEVRWDGRTLSGSEAASGLYFYRLQVNDFRRTGKMMKIK